MRNDNCRCSPRLQSSNQTSSKSTFGWHTHQNKASLFVSLTQGMTFKTLLRQSMAVTPDTQNDSKFDKSHMRMCKSTPAPSYSSRLLPSFSEQTTFIKPHPQEYKICHQAAFLPPTPILPPPLGASRYTAVLLHFNLHGVARFVLLLHRLQLLLLISFQLHCHGNAIKAHSDAVPSKSRSRPRQTYIKRCR